MLELAFRLAVAHAFTDYVFQTEFMGQAKDPASEYRRDKYGPWWWWAIAHGLINGAGVYWATGLLWLGLAETMVHALTDYCKCTGELTTADDQILHGLSKVAWLFITLRVT